MTLIEEISAWKADGFDDCLLGVGEQFGEGGTRYIYIYSKKAIIESIANDIVSELEERGGLDDEGKAELIGQAYDDALEYFSYNIAGAYIGPGMPVFMEDTLDESDE